MIGIKEMKKGIRKGYIYREVRKSEEEKKLERG